MGFTRIPRNFPSQNPAKLRKLSEDFRTANGKRLDVLDDAAEEIEWLRVQYDRLVAHAQGRLRPDGTIIPAKGDD